MPDGVHKIKSKAKVFVKYKACSIFSVGTENNNVFQWDFIWWTIWTDDFFAFIRSPIFKYNPPVCTLQDQVDKLKERLGRKYHLYNSAPAKLCGENNAVHKTLPRWNMVVAASPPVDSFLHQRQLSWLELMLKMDGDKQGVVVQENPSEAAGDYLPATPLKKFKTAKVKFLIYVHKLGEQSLMLSFKTFRNHSSKVLSH